MPSDEAVDTGWRRSRETADLLEQLQKAADEHRRILERQSQLIQKLRAEMKGVS